ncbi:MAG TPA: surface-adhesin E family protein [Longimicrobium sp.]
MYVPHTSAPRKRLSGWLAAALLVVATAVSPSALHGQVDSAAQLAQYHPLFGNTSRSVFLDTQTVTREGNIVTAWTLWQFASRRFLGETEHSYDAMKSQETYDCATRRYRSRRVQYFLRGSAVGRIFDNPSDWKEPDPRSAAAELVTALCAWAERN